MKAQSSIEYMTTYGWMLVVVILVIALLFMTGVLDIGKWMGGGTNAVTGLSSFSVSDFRLVPSGNISITLKSGVAANVSVIALAIDGANLTSVSPATPITFTPGQSRNITANCTAIRGAEGTTFYNKKVEIFFNVTGGGGGHIDTGLITGHIDPQ